MSETSRLYNAVPLHCIHALQGKFDPSVLQGRTIVPREGLFNDLQVRIEGKRQPWGRIVDHQEIMADNDDRYKYYGAVCISGLNIHQKNDAGKLVVTPEGRVVGILFATSSVNSRVTGFIVPAYRFFDQPAEHIRESIRDIFDLARLKDREIVGAPQLKGRADVSRTKVMLEGTYRRGRFPQKTEQLRMDHYQDDVIIRGEKYTRGLNVRAFKDFAGKKDIGKFLIRENLPSDREAQRIVGVIADVHKRDKDHIDVHVVPAWTLTRGF